MKFGTWAPVVLLACLVSQGQVLGHSDGSANPRTTISVKFFSIASSSSLKTNVATLTTSINNLSKTLSGLKTSSQTEELQEAADVLIPIVQQSVTFGTQLSAALTKLATDSTTPPAQLFQLFVDVGEAITTYNADNLESVSESLKEKMGCARKNQLESALSSFDVFLQVINIVSRIGDIVLDPDNARSAKQSPTATENVKSLIDSLSLVVKELNLKFTDFVTFVKNAISGLEMSNSFLSSLNTKEAKALTDLTKTAAQSATTAVTQGVNVINKYSAALLSIKTDLTNAIKGLSIFGSNQALKDLAKENEDFYGALYQFLEMQSTEDFTAIGTYYSSLGTKMKTSILQTADVFIDAVHRTGLRLADMLLEGAPNAASCFSTYNSKLSAPFTPLTTFVSSCLSRETTRVATIATYVENLLKLGQADGQELATNLGRCAKYSNYASSSEDAAKAEACMATNKGDMEALPTILGPQLVDVNQIVKRETLASSFRFQNCLATNLHEAVKGLKVMRGHIALCAGPFDDCGDRPRHDNDDGEIFDLDREIDDDTCRR